MLFEIKARPNILTSILPESIPLPRFSLFSVLEIDGAIAQITGIEFCRPEVANDRDMQPGWIYQLDDGSNLTTVIAEQELLDCLPVNEVEVVAIAA